MGEAPHFSLGSNFIFGHFVYGWRKADRYLYIGRAKQVGRLSTGHHIIGKREPVGEADTFDFWLCKTYYDVICLELKLILEHKPKYNRETIRLVERAIEIERKKLGVSVEEHRVIMEAEERYPGYKFKLAK